MSDHGTAFSRIIHPKYPFTNLSAETPHQLVSSRPCCLSAEPVCQDKGSCQGGVGAVLDPQKLGPPTWLQGCDKDLAMWFLGLGCMAHAAPARFSTLNSWFPRGLIFLLFCISVCPVSHDEFGFDIVFKMRIPTKYTIKLEGLPTCPHDWDCVSLRTNSHRCSTCRVLFSIVRLHFACRLEWNIENLSRVDDHVHLLPTSDLFRELKLKDEGDDDPKNTCNLELTIWSLTLISPFDHPATWDFCAAVAEANNEGCCIHFNIDRSKPCYGKKCE